MKPYKFLSLLTAGIFLIPGSGSGAGEKRPLYPDIIKCWQQAPLVKEYFSAPAGKYFAAEKDLAFWKRVCRELKAPRLRATLIRELAQLENPDIGKIFFPLFLKEEDPECIKAFLNTMENWSRKGVRLPAFPEKKFQELLTDEDPIIKSSLFALGIQAKWDLSLSRCLAAIDWKKDKETIRILFLNRAFLKGNKKEEGEKLLKRREKDARLFGLALLWDSTEEPDKEPLFRERLAGKDSLVCRLLLGKLVGTSPRKAPGLLQLLGEDKHPAVRLHLIENMVLHTQEKEALAARYLESSTLLPLRIAGAEVLGKGKTPRTLSLLLHALKDPDPVLRRTAGKALIERAPAASFRKRIAEECRKDPNAYKEGASFFAALPDRNIAGPFFAGLLQERNHPEVMLLDAMKGLEKIGDPVFAPIVSSYASSPSSKVRKACAGALGKMKNPKAVPALKRLMLDKDPTVSAQAFVSAWLWGTSLPFVSEIRRILRSRNTENSFTRAGAIRCAARLPETQFKAIMPDLEVLMLKECIVAPMMPKSYDVEEVRLSALLLLKERKESAAKKLFTKGLAQLEKESADPDRGGGEGTSLYEYIRQLKESMKGKKVIPSPVPDGKGIFSITRLD